MDSFLTTQVAELIGVERRLLTFLPDAHKALWDNDIRDALDQVLRDLQGRERQLSILARNLNITLENPVSSPAMQAIITETKDQIRIKPLGKKRDDALVALIEKAKHYELSLCDVLAERKSQLHNKEAEEFFEKNHSRCL